jgi:pimeloyl-ACP methyl ester carboxylesterase
MSGAPVHTPDNAPLSTRVPHLSPAAVVWLRRFFALLQALSPALAARAAFRLFLRTYRRPLLPEDRAALSRARQHRLMAGPDPMQVYEWGSSERRVIVLHGWGSAAARFSGLAEALQARGWHVIVPDAPGHGASPGSSSSLPQFVAGLDAVVARFGPPAALIGHSLGALGIAYRHAQGPPPWAGSLESVVLISMPSGAPFLMDVFVRTLGLRPTTQAHLMTLFERRFESRIHEFEALPGVTHMQARVMIVHDTGDDIVPYAHSDRLRQELAEASVLTTRELGHSALTRDAPTIGRIVEFLEQGRVRS